MKSTSSLSIPQEFTLMLFNEHTGYFHQVEGWTLNCAVSGAVLAELSLRSRIDTDEKSLFVIDSTKVGDPMLDLCLSEIMSHEKHQAPRYWVERLAARAEDVIDATLKSLVKLGTLKHYDGEFYTIKRSVQPAKKNGEAATESADHTDNIKSRIENVIFTDIIPDPEDSFIVGLLSACDVLRFIFDLDDESEERVERCINLELINRAISSGVEQSIIAPLLQKKPLNRKIPSVSLTRLILNRHVRDGNLPALFASVAEQTGPVFKIRFPFSNPATFIAGAGANRWMHRNARIYMTSGNYFRNLEGICGAQGLITSLDGADHFRLRKVMSKVYSTTRFDERLDEICLLTRRFMAENWHAGANISVKRQTRLMINLQMTRITVNTDTQDIFEELSAWKERASNIYVGNLFPKFMARTPAMKRRFKLLNTFVRRIERSHTPAQRNKMPRNLADDLISLHDSDPQFLPEQNLPFMLAAAPILQSIYLGDLLGFALFEMAKNPKLVEGIRAEADVVFDHDVCGKAAFSEGEHDVTRRFLMECLRMYPVVSMQVRNVANSCSFDDYPLPIGERIHIVQTATHYMSDLFPDPYNFDIDRYLPSRNEHKSIAYAPYGLGTHICVGSQWMNLQMMLTLMLIAYHFEFEPLPQEQKLKISPFPTLSVTEKLKVRIAKQLRTLPTQGAC